MPHRPLDTETTSLRPVLRPVGGFGVNTKFFEIFPRSVVRPNYSRVSKGVPIATRLVAPTV